MEKSKKKIIMVGIDGGHRDTLYRLIEEKSLPFFTRLAKNGIIVEKAVTCFPSTTVPCVTSMFTGCYFNKHSVLNNIWMNRFTTPVVIKAYIGSALEALKSFDKKLFGFPTILLPDMNKGGQVNNDISPDVQTIYEAVSLKGLTSYAYFHYIGKGATKWIRPRIKDMLLFAYLEKAKKDYAPFEIAMITLAIKHLKHFLPDITSIYFGCNDGNSHRNGVRDQGRYLKTVIDPQLSRLSSFLTSQYPDFDFYYSVTADHGQTEFEEKDKDKPLWIEDFKEVIHAADRTLTVDGGENTEISTDNDVVFTFGSGASIGLYIRNRKTKNWKDMPDFETDVIPILNTFLKISDGSFEKLGIKKKGFVDFLLTRENFNQPYKVYFNNYPYEGKGKLIELEEYFKDKSEYKSPVERIRGIDSPKSPDIIPMLNYIENKYSICSDFHKGNHGSLLADDSFIPMIFSGKHIKKGRIEHARLVDYAPTVASILNIEMSKADGKVLDIME